MTILYTRSAVESAANALNQPTLTKAYFEGDAQAFEQINTVLKDATWGDKQ